MIKKIVLFCFLLAVFACSNKGTKIPEFKLTTLDGKIISEKELEGKITVINVWATWCHSCLEEIPELNELVQIYAQDTAVLFLALSDEPEEKVKHFLQKRAFNFNQIPAATELTDDLQTRLVKTYPQFLIIGKDMKIKFERSSGLKNTREVLSREIESLR